MNRTELDRFLDFLFRSALRVHYLHVLQRLVELKNLRADFHTRAAGQAVY